MKAILVTGAAGFIGTRFVESCNSRQIPVISVDRISHFNTRPEHQEIRFGKKVDRDELMVWLTREEPALSAIVHLGACARTTETDWPFLQRNNVEYSQALWSFASEQGIPLIYASSAATYGDGSFGYADDE